MRVQIKKLLPQGLALFLLVIIACIATANETDDAQQDNLFVFVFKEGVAQPGIEVQVGDKSSLTDDFGNARFALPAEEYEVGYLKNGELFALAEVSLLETVSSQIFLNLTKKGADVELDLPLSAYEQNFELEDLKEQTGPKGTLKLIAKDTATQKLIAGGKLFFKGYAIDATTNEQGIAEVELSEGEYDISIVHPKYVMQVLKGVRVKADKVNQESVLLIKADIVLDEFVVSAPAVEGSLASTYTELKESNVIGDALSSEEFTKSGDSSAADALKRVTGITVVGGKFVYVRGLGERYSVVLLNDMHIPSPEPTKRVVPLDVFPSGVIQSMNIQKTWSPDLPGTFGGGDVLIQSKDIPKQDNYVSLSVSASQHDRVGETFKTNDDNRIGLPADIIQKSNNFQQIGRNAGTSADDIHAINSAIANYRSYNLKDSKIKPGYKASLSAGQSFKTSNGIKYGFVGNVYGSSDMKAKDAVKYSPVYNIDTATLSSGDRSEFTQVDYSEKLGGLLGTSIEFNEDHKLKYTFLGYEDNTESTTFSQKDGGQIGPGAEDSERSYLSYIEQTLQAHQLSGHHSIGLPWLSKKNFSDLELSWGFEIANATRFEPGTVEYTYEKVNNNSDFRLSEDIWFLYSDLDDEVENSRIDLKLPYQIRGLNYETSIGVFQYDKDRTLDNRRFKAEQSLPDADLFTDIDSLLTQQTVNNRDLEFTTNYRPADSYTATQKVTAYYINQLIPLSSQLELLAGVRIEDSTQELIDTRSGDPYDPLETSDTLPSVNLNYSINDDHVLRFGYSKTLSRPDFREFSPNRFKDPITEDLVFGYPELDYTTINNLDIKYEWYLSYDELFSVGLFRKDFTNPIETIIKKDSNSSQGNKIETYRNAEGATSDGIEFGLRKKLGFIHDQLQDFFVSTNYSYIRSEVQINKGVDDSLVQDLTTTDRAMQGQSPYVLNFNVGYDNINTGRSAVLAFNQFGKRIVGLGTNEAPDQYEQPFAKLDLVVKWKLNDTYDEQRKKLGYSVGLKVSNLLDSKQEVKQANQIVESYKPGTSINLSFSMKY